MLLADIEELRGRCQFAEIPRQETPAPIEGVQEDGYGDLGVLGVGGR